MRAGESAARTDRRTVQFRLLGPDPNRYCPPRGFIDILHLSYFLIFYLACFCIATLRLVCDEDLSTSVWVKLLVSVTGSAVQQ